MTSSTHDEDLKGNNFSRTIHPQSFIAVAFIFLALDRGASGYCVYFHVPNDLTSRNTIFSYHLTHKFYLTFILALWIFLFLLTVFLKKTFKLFLANLQLIKNAIYKIRLATYVNSNVKSPNYQNIISNLYILYKRVVFTRVATTSRKKL